MLVHALTFALLRTTPFSAAEPLNRVERRVVVAEAQGLWPQVPPESVRAWASSRSRAGGDGGDPEAWARRVAELIHVEPTAQADGQAPNERRLAYVARASANGSLPRGMYFVSTTRAAALARARFIDALERLLREDPAWTRAHPDISLGTLARNPGALLRFVWSPGTMRDACAHWLGTVPGK